jgi:hypothetical protein
MSRSLRKTPIFGRTYARSEAQDKRLWHKRWRAREREQLATIGADVDHVAVDRNVVSNLWDMAKDGKTWIAPRCQQENSERASTQRARPLHERKTLQVRLLVKWRSK